jgi:signal transduction histidine kinase
VRDALMMLSRRLTAILDPQVLAPTLTEGLVARIPVMHASLHRRAAGGTFTVMSHSTSAQAEAEWADDVDLVPLAARLTVNPVAVADLARRSSPSGELRATIGGLQAAQVALVVPLFVEGQVSGIILLGEKVSGVAFQPFELELLEMLGGQTAIALENSRLYSDLRTQMQDLHHAQQQVMQSAKLAAVGELAASVAHEINNPLMIIMGNAQLGLLDGSTDDRSTRLATIEREAARAGRITRNLLNLARRHEPKREPVAMNALVERLFELLAVKLKHSKVRTDVALDPDLPLIIGDGDHLTQVLLNLAGNAVDAMPDGGRLRVETERDGSGSVLVRVIDTGVGMPPEVVARIFEPFYTTKPEGKGTGLGMSICVGILKSHGGALEVQTKPGQGTTMLLRLPVSPAVSAPEEVTA